MKRLLAPLGILAVCGVLIVFGSQLLQERQARLAGMVTTDARVVGIEERRSSPTSRNVSFWVHVRFLDTSGAEIEAAYQHGMPILVPAEGELMPIAFDPANPLAIEGTAPLTMWGVFGIAALAVALFGWLGLGLLWQQSEARSGPFSEVCR